MRILCITPINKKTITPETGFATLLRKRGHDILVQFTGYNINLIELYRRVIDFNPDVIWGMMEYSLPTAHAYKKLLNKPMIAHIECIPPWRTGLEDPKEFGFDYNDKIFERENDIDNTLYTYKVILEAFNDADFRTISQESWRYSFEKVMGHPIDAEARYYTYNYENLAKPDMKLKEKNQIFTIARFTPIKRIHHVITALSLIDKKIRPKYVIVGYGAQKDYLVNLAKELDVEIELVGDGKDGIKERVIQESMFGVQIFSGMTAVEAAYYSKPVIGYDLFTSKESLGDSVVWVKNNSIVALKEKIEELIDDKKKRVDLGIKANKMIKEGKTKIKSNNEFLDDIERHIKIAIEKQIEEK